jgi:hypothetical protein
MKKIMTLCAVIVAFVSFTAMQTDNKSEFKFAAETHDFGKIPQGKPVSYEFKFTNIGEEPLIITAVEPACGCTIADFTKTPIKNGQSGSITLTYNAAAMSSFTKAATVKSNSKTPVKVLYLKGEVIENKNASL